MYEHVHICVPRVMAVSNRLRGESSCMDTWDCDSLSEIDPGLVYLRRYRHAQGTIYSTVAVLCVSAN